MSICEDPLQRRCWNPVLVDGMVCDPCYAESHKHWIYPRSGEAEGPYWTCKCGGWKYRAQAIPRRKTGNNKIEAERAYREHLAVMGKKVRTR